MARRSRDKRKAELQRMEWIAKKLGFSVDDMLEQIPATDFGAEAVERSQIEAESVLFYIKTKGKGFQQKTCAWKECDGLFLHTYSAVAYCSDECRAWALAEHGLIWNYHRRSDSERWNVANKGYVPKVISAEATAALIESGNFFGEIPEQRDEEDDVQDH
jgi:hypothetical protein